MILETFYPLITRSGSEELYSLKELLSYDEDYSGLGVSKGFLMIIDTHQFVSRNLEVLEKYAMLELILVSTVYAGDYDMLEIFNEFNSEYPDKNIYYHDLDTVRCDFINVLRAYNITEGLVVGYTKNYGEAIIWQDY